MKIHTLICYINYDGNSNTKCDMFTERALIVEDQSCMNACFLHPLYIYFYMKIMYMVDLMHILCGTKKM